jgi:hypothetical protein
MTRHDLGALELRADDERRTQTAKSEAYCFPARGQCASDPTSCSGSKKGPLLRAMSSNRSGSARSASPSVPTAAEAKRAARLAWD